MVGRLNYTSVFEEVTINYDPARSQLKNTPDPVLLILWPTAKSVGENHEKSCGCKAYECANPRARLFQEVYRTLHLLRVVRVF
jgi:hypothetical protein